MTDKEKCFIIMPISTPPHLRERYDDPDHFKHVLEHLFIPAVEAAGLEPVRPIAEGSELIHARIVKHIEESPFLLCDMTALNPNVFFELGIRTAINRPTILVKDDTTDRTPFDLGLINNHTYESELRPWNSDEQIRALQKHIESSMTGGDGNPLWEHFSMSASAQPLKESSTVEEKVDYLLKMIEGGKNDNPGYYSSKRPKHAPVRHKTDDSLISDEQNKIKGYLLSVGAEFGEIVYDTKRDAYVVYLYGIPDIPIAQQTAGLINQLVSGSAVEFRDNKSGELYARVGSPNFFNQV